MRHARTGGAETDLGHRVFELRAVLCLVDRFRCRADQLDIVFFQYAVTMQIERAVERGLATHSRQNRVWLFGRDNALHHLPGDRLDVGDVGHLGVGHDGGRIAVDQNDFVTLFTQGLAGLCAGVVKFAGLTNDDRASADNKNAV